MDRACRSLSWLPVRAVCYRKEVRSIIVTLVPHDMGIAAFEGVLLEGGAEGEAVLHHPMGDIRYRRVQK